MQNPIIPPDYPSDEKIFTAINHRLVGLKAIKTLAIAAFLIAVYFAWSGNWLKAAISVAAWMAAGVATSVIAERKARRVTGLSHAEQATIWEAFSREDHPLHNVVLLSYKNRLLKSSGQSEP